MTKQTDIERMNTLMDAGERKANLKNSEKLKAPMAEREQQGEPLIYRAVGKIEKIELSLVDAVQSGLAVLKEDVDKLIAESLAENEKKIEKKIRKELAVKLQDEGIEKRQANSLKFIEGTGLTDKEFGKRLIKMNVQKKYISILRDEHHKLKDREIWRYIQLNYKEKKEIKDT